MDSLAVTNPIDADQRSVAGALCALVRGDQPVGGYAAFAAACQRLDLRGDGFEIDAFPIRANDDRFDTRSSASRVRSLADAVFFALLGAVAGYAMLVVSGAAYKGHPDFVDRLLWRIVVERRIT